MRTQDLVNRCEAPELGMRPILNPEAVADLAMISYGFACCATPAVFGKRATMACRQAESDNVIQFAVSGIEFEVRRFRVKPLGPQELVHEVHHCFVNHAVMVG